MTVPMYLDGASPDMPFIYVQNPAGGLFPDDDLLVSLDVASEGRVHLTTQSATKVYAGDGARALQRTQLKLGAGAYVEVMPDTLIPHAGADVEQELSVELGEGAALVAADLVAAGRHIERERFAYGRVRLTSSVADTEGTELYVDALELEPARHSPSARGVLGERAMFGTFTAVAPHLDAERRDAAVDGELATEESVRAGAGVLPRESGVVARILGQRAIDARRAIDRAWAIVRRELLGAPLPPRRK
ncbi:MAG: urease accessory protein UreD [Gaiellaceae bacterium]